MFYELENFKINRISGHFQGICWNVIHTLKRYSASMKSYDICKQVSASVRKQSENFINRHILKLNEISPNYISLNRINKVEVDNGVEWKLES